MRFNKKIACIISALCISFMPISDGYNAYAQNDTNQVEKTDKEKLEDTQRELEDTKKRLEDVLKDKEGNKNILEEEKKQKERDYRVAVEFEPDLPNLTPETQDKITLKIKNSGGEHLEKSKIKISAMPPEVSLISGGSPEQNLGTIHVGNSQSVDFDVNIGKDAKEGNYPISFEFSANYGTDVNNYKSYTYSKIFYIKVNKKVEEKKKDETQYKPFLIQNISHPAIINKGDIANLKFKIKNPNNKTMNSVKISILPDEGIVNQTQNVFVENNFKPNAEKEFSVKLFPQDKAEKKNYSIKITVEPTNPNVASSETKDNNNSNEKEEPKILPTATQYTGIFYNAPPKEDEKEKEKDTGVKNPQIIISNYSYGGNPVQPNQQFPLTMSFINTSNEKTLKNIKISLLAEESAFIAVNSSNSFFVNSMMPNSSVTKTITFSVKPDAPTKTIPINIDYTYEDSKGNPLTAKDTISIPVIQKTLLSIDEISPPRNSMEGEPVNLNVNFYNLGKTQISNLKITASGDFTASGDATYFVGNLDAGKNDSFSLSAIPNDPKKISGRIEFLYETLDGQAHTIEKLFDFALNPMPAENLMPPEMQKPEMPKKDYKMYYIGGGIFVFAVVLGIILKKRHNKKKMQEFDLDE